MYALRPGPAGLEALLLRRSPPGRCPGSWETVHGHIEPGEAPVAAALRELSEETGLTPVRFYNASRIESFYMHRLNRVALIPVFAAFVAPGTGVRLSAEHDSFAWHPVAEAATRFAWPRERRAIADLAVLFAAGNAGPLEDVLLISPANGYPGGRVPE